MSLQQDYDDQWLSDLNSYEEEIGEIEEEFNDTNRKRNVRRELEDRLERKRLEKELIDELDAEFDWDDLGLK
jgi:hypothetical protein